MCERKGIHLVGTSDVTHPAWRSHLGEELEEAEGGAYVLSRKRSPVRFLLTTELSCIYKRGGKVRRVHHVIVFPSLKAVDACIETLGKRGCNLKADGRPILGIDSEELLKMFLSIDERILLIPAHAWTPWFAIFGSQSGFDSLEECFGEMTKYIYAIETGLSSDPPMNRRLSALDRLFLVSNSDAHSLDKLGREANVFEMGVPCFDEFRHIMIEHDEKKFLETIEFFPEEGKYHADGHRACRFSCEPEETHRRKGVCPVCGKPLTVGVLSRVFDLADRKEGKGETPYRYAIPLAEVVSSVLGVSPSSKRVSRTVDAILLPGKTEFGVLLDENEEELSRIADASIVSAILAIRRGDVERKAGYDGEFGVIRARTEQSKQKTLL